MMFDLLFRRLMEDLEEFSADLRKLELKLDNAGISEKEIKEEERNYVFYLTPEEKHDNKKN